ncbi:Hsp20/alpha crystallin family protein [Streptomyces sp. 2A115]|uniref:Hsp20/alpha crystallin family protein n=1 Tax=Streptomyces sp. 2A115 TaxID=3457439 RepID=UPI003FD24118
MSSTREWLPSRLTPPDLSDWAEAGFPVMDTVPETYGIHVEERLTDGTWVVRAELPGMDPAKDIEVTVTERFLTLGAGRSVETTTEKHDTTIRYGHFTPLPAGARGDEATAQYKHGVLTITMPVVETKTGAGTIPVREPLSASAR